MSTHVIGYMVILAGLLLLSAYGGEVMESKPSPEVRSIAQMQKLSLEQRLQLLDGLCKDRAAVQRALLDQLATSKVEQDKFAVVYLLGMYRMEGAVPQLATLILLKDNQQEIRDRESLWDVYPVVEALIRIGNPAVPKMVENIENSGDANVRELSARVISYVDGPQVGGYLLQLAMQKQADAEKKARLQSAVDYMAKEAMRRGP